MNSNLSEKTSPMVTLCVYLIAFQEYILKCFLSIYQNSLIKKVIKTEFMISFLFMKSKFSIICNKLTKGSIGTSLWKRGTYSLDGHAIDPLLTPSTTLKKLLRS